MVVAPHHQAAQAGLRVLQDGGNAIEAMVAAAAAITVVYPHMNAMGGDNFWLISIPGTKVIGIDACGAAAEKADVQFYRNLGLSAIPSRGHLAALTVAGAVSGWKEALMVNRKFCGGSLSLDRLMEDAIFHAETGVPVTKSLALNAASKFTELKDVPGFKEAYLLRGEPLIEGQKIKQPRIAETFRKLVENGLDDFYRGKLAKSIGADLERLGSPLRLDDLKQHHARRVNPLMLNLAGHNLYNMPPPTQGLASLILLGIYDRLGIEHAEKYDFVHGLIEATKSAFCVRDKIITDPVYMDRDPSEFLESSVLDKMARNIDMNVSQPWPAQSSKGDTVWLGAIDSEGRAVSFIQSIYWEFGSGAVLEETGITWQNRGISFSLDPENYNCLKPFRRPFHTIQPALAHLTDGRVMPYGSMGGEGQPQTQAMIFSRHVLHGQELQQAITAPRWLLGRTWGQETTNLRIENRYEKSILSALRNVGHDIEVIGPFDEIMGHAGALVYRPDGLIEGAADPRGDGIAAAF
tara:strand:- start:668 stop:2230 length:1563 start_codon:yes stop_codon:yes gene_type:complete